ncbi:hypothetical protein [Vulcanococcus limneticus]|uniref:hypothetical protein n=1 Tax=Vulcanococcus limneticus TaxID=2170428 RepID=UPI00398BFDAB
MISEEYKDFFPASASAPGNRAVGKTADLYDSVNKRFIGPLSIFVNQRTWAEWTHDEAWKESDWASTAAKTWMEFGSDVPFGAMPYGGAGEASPGTGFVPSSEASQTTAAFEDLPKANPNWPSRINGAGGAYSTYPAPVYGFDFSISYPFGPDNTDDTSGEGQKLPTNFAVWNKGSSQYNPSRPANNVSPDNYKVGTSFYTNGYTAALRAQALTDEGQHVVDGKPKSSFFTFPLDNFNAEFNNYDPSSISLTVHPLATANIVGTAENDVITGTSADDTFIGGAGGDTFSGSDNNGGNDRYLYFSASESGPKGELRDNIIDFGSEDKIDFTGLDADSTRSGLQAFKWIGQDGFSGKAGELRYEQDGFGIVLQGTTDSGRQPEFELFLLGVSSIDRSQLELFA